MPSWLVTTGRVLGVACGGGAFLLLLGAILGVGMVHGRFAVDSTYVVVPMALLGAAAAAAAWLRKAGVLLVLGVLSLAPFGLYLLGVPHWLRWVGIADLGCLVAAALLWAGGRGRVETRSG